MKNILYYATGNKGKFEELSNFVKHHIPTMELHQLDNNLDEIQSLDQREIALHKARQAYKILQKPVIVDDSGIFFKKYKEFPGTLSKFIFHTIGFEGLLKLVAPGDEAEFVLTLVYYFGPEKYVCFEGKCSGYITLDQVFKAPESLPYDILFSPEKTNKSYAALRNNIKEFEEYNYRIRAFKKFIEWYTQHYLEQ